ncbi:MAG: hypothetical protein ACYCOY_10095 [Metallibacterium sp.]
MKNENHRAMAVKAFRCYQKGELALRGRVESVRLSTLEPDEVVEKCKSSRCVYVLRLDQVDGLDPAVSSITPSDDVLRILYIGGHKPSDGPKGRFNAMLKAARAAQQHYQENGYAWNDKSGGWGHPVAGMLTTALLSTGFRIDKHCVLDLINGDGVDALDELDLMIGYQERYHHLPPWNASRKGGSAFKESSVKER